eukprot:TRINITY_DN10259_c0_g1_i1.p1 TRINITY_DN10259_c0_g1~~TRINITY_DN10259_c0_g1_i1.p1  ORF type:complete len:449 (+),score=83.57 TRINITY_DN10259_c0_g1_i1:145-1347(+)
MKLICEIDTYKLENPSMLDKNVKNLTKVTKVLLNCIWKSSRKIPFFIKDLMVQLHRKLSSFGVTPLQIVGTMFFLRLINPVVSKYKYKTESQRTVLLMAKLLQLIVNKISTLENDNLLKIMEPLLAKEIPKAERFAKTVLNVNESSDSTSRYKPKQSSHFEKRGMDLYLWLKKKEEALGAYLSTNYGETSSNIFRDQISSVHSSFGSDPNSADDWQTVWRRVRHHLDSHKGGSEILISDTSDNSQNKSDDAKTTESDDLRTEYDDDSSFTFSSYTSPHSSRDQNRSPRTHSPIPSPPSSPTSPSFKPIMVIKCFQENTKRLKLIHLEKVVTFAELLDLIQHKFCFKGPVPFRLRYTPKPQNSPEKPADAFIDDRTSLERFFEKEGKFDGCTVIYALWVVE